MNWKNLFISGENLSPDDARKYMEEHDRGSFQILDVRQAKEYEQDHIAGSLLIPVKELLQRTEELDPDKPVLVY